MAAAGVPKIKAHVLFEQDEMRIIGEVQIMFSEMLDGEKYMDIIAACERGEYT